MSELHPDTTAPATASSTVGLCALLIAEWPYLLILVFAVLGVAYTSVAQRPITTYWLALAPFIGVVCIVTHWRAAPNREARTRLVWTQVLHWAAVLIAMNLVFLADVGQMMNADARALAILILLALGTFTAGVHVGSWHLGLVGIILGLGVPAIAWLEQSALLLVLAVVVVAGLAFSVWRYVAKPG